MTETSELRRWMNMPLLAVASILALSFGMAVMSAKQVAADGPHSPMSVRDDNCYSSINAFGSMFKFGLVNAIVDVPIYDWDQNTPGLLLTDDMTDAKLDARGLFNTPVGYAQAFDFSVTPIPNLRWTTDYLTKQLPYDIALLASLAGGPAPRNEPDPLIANPFVYQQAAVIDRSGTPKFQVFNRKAGDTQYIPTDANGAGGFGNSNPITNPQNQDALDGVGSIWNGSGLQNYDPTTASGIDAILNGPLGFASQSYHVDGRNPASNCYESINFANSNKVPAYAFSVPNAGIPVTIPGTAYSLLTLLFKGTMSFDGMTIYPSSLNGKDMLDCYGRGITATVSLTAHKMGEWSSDPEYLFWKAIAYAADYAVNAAQAPWAGMLASGNPFLMIPAAAAVAVITEGRGGWHMQNLPTPHTRWINYYNGFVFGFKLNQNNIELPDYLKNRAIDFGKSRLYYMDLVKFAWWDSSKNDNGGHEASENGKQFHPNLYLQLKKSYELHPNVDLHMNPGDNRRTPDGTEVRVDISVDKTGFKSTPRYDRDATDRGGPTFERRDGRTNIFTRARVYRVEMAPGVTPNAIDKEKFTGSGTSYFTHLNGEDPCALFSRLLRDGDDANAMIPSHRTTTANKDVDEFNQPDAVKCGLVPGSGNPINVLIDENGRTYDNSGNIISTNNNQQLLNNYIEKIPAETPPGTKICYAVYMDSYGNDVKYEGQRWWRPGDARIFNYNPNYSADPDKSFLDRVTCIISGYKPSFQVRSGDLMVGKSIYTGTNTKDFLATSDPNDKRTYGSWAEYGAFAGGVVSQLGSGSIYRLGMPQSLIEYGYLTFSNNRDNAGGSNYGQYNGASSLDSINDGFSKVADQFTATSGSAQIITGDTVDVKSLTSGTYLLPAGPVSIVTGDPADTADDELAVNRSIILLAQRNTVVNINSNIRTPVQYSSIGDISQVVIAPASTSDGFKINIADRLSRVDAWLINPNGEINTCYIANPGSRPALTNTPRSKTSCDSTLYINGPVSAQILYLRRSGGKDQSSTPNVIEQSVPGEIFNLRPDAYLWATSHVDDGSKKYVTTNVIDVPPRY